MASVNETAMYALADACGMVLEIGAKNAIQGSKVRTLTFGDVPVEFNSRIVSSLHLTGGEVAMIMRIKGNLSVLFTRDKNRLVSAMLLNLSHMGKPDGWLEASAADSTLDGIVAQLGKAIVTTFRHQNKIWQKI